MRRKVLVVDSDAEARSLYRSLLAERGYDVVEASTVEDAFANLADGALAVVLSLELPDDGAEQILRALARWRGAPPVVLCTATVRARPVARRYHIAALGKFALEAIGDEVERVIAASQRPRLSRVSVSSESRPSFA